MSTSLDRKKQVLIRAAESVKRRDFHAAEQMLTALLADDPAIADEHVLSLCAEASLERVLHQGGNLDMARGLLHQALRLPSLSHISYGRFLNRLGIVSYYGHRYRDAI